MGWRSDPNEANEHLWIARGGVKLITGFNKIQGRNLEFAISYPRYQCSTELLKRAEHRLVEAIIYTRGTVNSVPCERCREEESAVFNGCEHRNFGLTKDPALLGHGRRRARTDARTTLLDLSATHNGSPLPQLNLTQGVIDNPTLLAQRHAPRIVEPPLFGLSCGSC